ncbi:MAG: YjbE family putative metal transport protein [Gammaproteobacteria bacterium]|nr:YjbE family putative metal transport protein [Gammaproteobacteria bacterium]
MENLDSLFKLGQIIIVDLVLAGDNAIVIGLVAAKFSAAQRRRVIFYGVGAAVLMRILFAVITVQLLQIIGLLLAGGLLLLWICWKLWRDLRAPPEAKAHGVDGDGNGDGDTAGAGNGKDATVTSDPPLRSAIMQIVVADVSMSLDNVLAVAGIAEGHTLLLVFGLALSVALMAFAATLIANMLERHRWIGYVGLVMILYVALKMIYTGTLQLL